MRISRRVTTSPSRATMTRLIARWKGRSVRIVNPKLYEHIQKQSEDYRETPNR
jgi:hypothetical protein